MRPCNTMKQSKRDSQMTLEDGFTGINCKKYDISGCGLKEVLSLGRSTTITTIPQDYFVALFNCTVHSVLNKLVSLKEVSLSASVGAHDANIISTSEKAILENLRCLSGQEAREVEKLHRDVLQRRREAQQWKLNLKRQLLEDELQQLELEIKETRGRMQHNSGHGQTHEDPNVHQTSYGFGIRPEPANLSVFLQGTGPAVVESSVSTIKEVDLDPSLPCICEEAIESIASTTNYSDSFVGEQEGETPSHAISTPKKLEEFDHVEEVDTEEENIEVGSQTSAEVSCTESSYDLEHGSQLVSWNGSKSKDINILHSKFEGENFHRIPSFCPSPERFNQEMDDEIEEELESMESGEAQLKDLVQPTAPSNPVEYKLPYASQCSLLHYPTQEPPSQEMPPRKLEGASKQILEPLEHDSLSETRISHTLIDYIPNNRIDLLDSKCSNLKAEKMGHSKENGCSSREACSELKNEESVPAGTYWNPHIDDPVASASGCIERSPEFSFNNTDELPEDEISEGLEHGLPRCILSSRESVGELKLEEKSDLAKEGTLSLRLTTSAAKPIARNSVVNKLQISASSQSSSEEEIGEVSEEVSLRTDAYSDDDSDL